MKQVITETQTHDHVDQGNIYQNIIRVFFGFVGTCLVIRLFLKFFAASTGSSFVNFVYRITNFLVRPFEGIIKDLAINNSNPAMILETATIFSLILVGFIAWAVYTILNSFITRGRAETIKTTDIT